MQIKLEYTLKMSSSKVFTIGLDFVGIVHYKGRFVLMEEDLDPLGEEAFGGVDRDVDLGACDVHLTVHSPNQAQ